MEFQLKILWINFKFAIYFMNNLLKIVNFGLIQKSNFRLLTNLKLHIVMELIDFDSM